MREALGRQLRGRDSAPRRQVEAGGPPPLPARLERMTDDELGAWAVAASKASR